MVVVSYEIKSGGVLVSAGNGTDMPAFGLDGKGCPSRLYKRLGRYALKQFEKVEEENMEPSKAYVLVASRWCLLHARVWVVSVRVLRVRVCACTRGRVRARGSTDAFFSHA